MPKSSRSRYVDLADHIGYGVVLLNRKGRLLQANRAAQQLIDGSDGVDLVRGRLQLRSDTQADLDRLLGALTAARSSISFEIPRALGAALEATLISAVDKEPFGQTYLLILVDRLGQAAAVVAMMEREFGLTTAECRFAAAFSSVADLRMASNVMGIAQETGRRHIKSIFHKTGTHGQLELILLLRAHPVSIFACPDNHDPIGSSDQPMFFIKQTVSG